MQFHHVGSHMRDSNVPCRVHTLGTASRCHNQYLLLHRKAYMSLEDGAQASKALQEAGSTHTYVHT